MERRDRIRISLLAWYDANRRDLPWRRTPQADDPYAILVSEVMLQQTHVERVIPKYDEFLARFPSLRALAGASTAEVIRVWAPLGYNRRAVNLQHLARAVAGSGSGALPDEPKALRSLPGVGAYTAAAIACFAFGRAEAVVDTNVRRVLKRLERKAALSERDLAGLAASYLPRERAGDWNQALMDLAASLCRSSSPLCLVCPLRADCRSAGSVVREQRASYKANKQERYEGSNRHLRGQIVDHLRAAPAEVTIRDLGDALGLIDSDGYERLCELLAGLESDGLLSLNREHETVNLPV